MRKYFIFWCKCKWCYVFNSNSYCLLLVYRKSIDILYITLYLTTLLLLVISSRDYCLFKNSQERITRKRWLPQAFKAYLKPILHNLSKYRRGDNTFQLILWNQYYPNTNPDKDSTKKLNYRQIFRFHIDTKFLTQY